MHLKQDRCAAIALAGPHETTGPFGVHGVMREKSAQPTRLTPSRALTALLPRRVGSKLYAGGEPIVVHSRRRLDRVLHALRSEDG